MAPNPSPPLRPVRQASPAKDRGARRSRLRDFQDGLMERLAAARSGVDSRVNQLGIEVGGDHWLVELKDVGEIVPVTAITPVPLTHDWFLGLANIRGNLFSVIDFARFQGGAPTPLTRDCRIMALAPGLSFNSAILVSRVAGLRNGARMRLQETPAAAGARVWLDEEAVAWRALDLSLLAQDARFLQIAS
jgi:twitching motility protein PilI